MAGTEAQEITPQTMVITGSHWLMFKASQQVSEPNPISLVVVSCEQRKGHSDVTRSKVVAYTPCCSLCSDVTSSLVDASTTCYSLCSDVTSSLVHAKTACCSLCSDVTSSLVETYTTCCFLHSVEDTSVVGGWGWWLAQKRKRSHHRPWLSLVLTG